MAKFNIQINIPIEMNTDDLDIDNATLEDHLQWALGEEKSYRAPFHVEMLERGFHEVLKLSVKNAVEELEEHKHKGEYIDDERVSPSGNVSVTHTPVWGVTAPPIYNRFRIEKMGDWQLSLIPSIEKESVDAYRAGNSVPLTKVMGDLKDV